MEQFAEGVVVALDDYPSTDEEIPAFLARVGVPGIVDIHAHAMPERLQQAVWSYFDGLTEPAWPIRYRDDLDARLQRLRDVGVVAHSALAYAHKPGMLRWLNDFTLDLADVTPQVVPTFTVYPEDGVTAEVERALERGGVVCKVHNQLSRYTLDDPRLSDAWRLLEEARTLVVAHTSAVYGVEGGHETSGGDQVFRVRDTHPDLRISIAHLGLPDPDGRQWEAIETLDHVFADTSAALVEPPPEVLPAGAFRPEDVRERLTDHLLFGTDYPSVPYRIVEQVRGLSHLHLDPAGLRAVLHDRSAALLAEAGWTVPA